MAKPPVSILYEDNHLLVVNKKPGDLVQTDKDKTPALEDLLKDYIKERDKKTGNVFLGVVHRIDRPVSGVVLFAKTSKALSRLNAMIQEHQIKKTYWAITIAKPQEESGELNHFIRRDEKKNLSVAYPKEVPGSKSATLKYKYLAGSDHYYLFEIELITGRHHQIRCQFGKIGCSIKGDLKYGAPRSNPDASICLHSRSMSFIHPVTEKPVEIIAPVPEDNLWQFFVEAGK